MKIAGRKNDGAWERANKYIQKLSAEGRPALQGSIEQSPSINQYVAGLQEIEDRTGSPLPEGLMTAEAIASRIATVGVTRQMYMGYLTFDTYTKNSKGKYVPDHAALARHFGQDLRQILKEHMFAAAAFADLDNVLSAKNGNRGGIADATKGT